MRVRRGHLKNSGLPANYDGGGTFTKTESKGLTPMPTSDSGKAIASRNATTHGLFARDVVLPSLGEDPDGYHQMEAEWTSQLSPGNLLDRHYVEKIAAASWRLRRLHRWQAQIFEDESLTEAERLDRLDKVLRHETALHRQIDTAVKLLAKDVPLLYRQRIREQVLEDAQLSERGCREDAEDDRCVDLEIQNRLYRIRKATAQAMNELSTAPLDAADDLCPQPASPEHQQPQNCQNEPATPGASPAQAADPVQAAASPTPLECDGGETEIGGTEKCQNERPRFFDDPRRVTEYLDPGHRQRFPVYPAPTKKGRLRRS